MPISITEQITDQQKAAIVKLWNAEYPEKLGFADIFGFDDYISHLSEVSYYLLENDKSEIEGWALTFVRDREVWFALVVDSQVHGKGNGSLLLNKLKENEAILNAWAVDHENDLRANGEVYRSPLNFYLEKHGFRVIPEIRIEIPTLSAVKIIWERGN